MPPRKPNPTTATTQILRPESVDDLKDTAPLAPKLDKEARALMVESRNMIGACIRSLRLSWEGEFGALHKRIEKYLSEHPE